MERSKVFPTIWLALCGLLCSVSPSMSTGLETTPDYYWDSQNFGSGLCIVKINSDGYPDVVGSYLEGGARYLMNDGPNWNWCEFDPQSGSSIEFGANQIKADIIYFIWDHMDVAMVSEGQINVYRNDRDGDLNLQHSMSIPESGTSNWIDVGKVNSDGYPDLVASAVLPPVNWKAYVYAHYNDTIPNSPSQELNPSDGPPQQIQLAPLRLNASREDIAVAAAQFILCYTNSNMAGYYLPNPVFNSMDPPEDVIDFAIADLDGDSDLDIVACSENRVQVFGNDSSPYTLLFFVGQQFAIANIRQVALGEFNYDGLPDLAVATTTNVTIYLNEGGPFNITQNPPAWQYNRLGQDFGGTCDMNELQFSDLRGLGSQSIVFSARGNGTGAIGVFKNIGNSPITPVRNFSVSDGQPGGHPNLIWLRNEELDADHYDIYRALMPDETPPSAEDFELLTTIDHPDTSYIDTTVTIHTQYDNYKIWYAAKAVDTADQESLWSNFVRFWGYYENSGSSPDHWTNATTELRLSLSAAPNPANNETHLIYGLTQASIVRLHLVDTGGRSITELYEGWAEAGEHSIAIKAHDLPSGIYFARLVSDGNVAIQKLVLLK